MTATGTLPRRYAFPMIGKGGAGSASPKQPSRPAGGSRPIGHLLVVFGWLLLPPGFLVELVAFGAMRPGGEKPVWAPAVGAGFALAGLGIFLAARYLLRQGKRHLSPITTVDEVVSGPPFVLYLRSFSDDPKLARVTPHANLRSTFGDERIAGQSLRTEEEELRAAVAPFGGMVAVGRPGERLPEVGARRLYVSDDDWQASVLRLMAEASKRGLVLIGVGLSRSLRWELAQAVRNVVPQRLVLVVAMDGPEYETFRQEVRGMFPVELPPYPSGHRLVKYRAMIRGAVYFEPDWSPRFVRFDTPQSPGNFQRVIESRFVHGMRPVYERLGLAWPGVTLRLPIPGHITRRQIPVLSATLGIPLVIIVLILVQVLTT